MQSSAKSTADRVQDIPSMVLNIETKQLLLPGVAVAEIIGNAVAEPIEGSPEWFLGWIEWRKLRVPVVSFERLNGEIMIEGSRRLAVLNNTGVDRERVPFLAIPIKRIPQLARVLPGDLRDMADAQLGIAELAVAVDMQGQVVTIPNVAVLEQALADYLGG